MAARAELPVPKTFCITTNAYKCFFDAISQVSLASVAKMEIGETILLGKQIQQMLFRYPLPVDVASDIRRAYKELIGDQETAVVLRPSMAYDSPFTFARMLRPILNVVGMIEFEKAIKICWAYAWTEELIRYRYRKQLPPRFDDMSILVQHQVETQVSGSAITLNPITGRQEEIIIEAYPGLNESVSRGLVIPDRYIWHRFFRKVTEKQIERKEFQLVLDTSNAPVEKEIEESKQEEPSLITEQLENLVALLEKTLPICRYPVEVEWSLANNRFYILQLNPIKEERETLEEEDKWVENTTALKHFQEPISPLGWSLTMPVLQEAVQTVCQYLQLDKNLTNEKVFHLINYYIYINRYFLENLSNMQSKASDKLKNNTALSFSKLVFKMWQLKLYWHPLYKRYVKQIKELWAYDYSNATKDGLMDHVEQIMQTVRLFFRAAIMVTLLKNTLRSFWKHYILQKLHKPEAIQYEEQLFSALPNRTAATNQALDELVRLSGELPEVSRIIQGLPLEEVLERLEIGESGREFVRALKTFLGQYGHKEISIDPINATWVEQPNIVLKAIRNALLHEQHFWDEGQVTQREHAEREIQEKICGMNYFKRFMFNYMLHLTQDYTAIYEDEHYYITMYVPLLRRTLLTLAPYLNLEQKEDIFYLSMDEIRAYLRSPLHTMQLHEQIQSRKNERRIARKVGRHDPNELRNIELNGIPASAGRHLGKIRIIQNFKDIASLKHGEVMVTDYFEPGWEQALYRASGLITDLGGLLSYGASLARKLEIPAVTGVKTATKELQTGHIVNLDGYLGKVIAYKEDLFQSDCTEEHTLSEQVSQI